MRHTYLARISDLDFPTTFEDRDRRNANTLVKERLIARARKKNVSQTHGDAAAARASAHFQRSVGVFVLNPH